MPMGFRKGFKKLFSFKAASAKTTPPPQAKEQPIERTLNEQVVAEYLRLVNDHQNFGCIFDPHVDILFIEAPMTLDGYLEENEKLFKSFPDFSMHVQGGIHEREDGKVVIDISVSGTHTGAPYGFGPFPEIEATNIKVKNDPERCTFTIKDGKITKLLVEPAGELTGPPGIYTQIGGLIF